MKRVRLVRGLLGVIVLGIVSALPDGSEAAACGPGAGWVSSCPAGDDTLNSVARHGIVVFDLEDGGFIINLPDLFGPATIHRGAGSSGHIDTEMVALSLSGGGLTLQAGDGTGNLLNDGPLFSPGAIDEVSPGSPFANSFFDIFFEIDPTPFGPLHNTNACTMRAVIDRVPPLPGTTYICDATDIPLDLFDAGGVHRAVLLGSPSHIILAPEPSALFLLGSGLAGLGAMVWRRTRGR